MKKIDELERFVQEERGLFDTNIPNKKIWENISRQLKSGSASMVWFHSGLIRGIAAGFLLLFLGGSIGYFIGHTKEPSLWNVGKETMPFSDFEFVSKKSIREKIFQLKSLKAEESIFSDLEQMDKSMEELKKELEGIPKGQEKIILEQLKRGYKTKIEMLDRIILRLESKTTNQDEKAI